VQVVAPPGVFRPISDSWFLADALRREGLGPQSEVLDLCTGSGVLALAAAAEGARVTAVDVSRRAVWTTRLNARRAGLAVRVVRGRTFAPVGDRRFDLIVSNPPYVPSPDDDLPTRGPARAWAAGPDGRAVLDEICDGAARHLYPGGVLLVVHSSLIDEHVTLARLEAAGLARASVVERHRGPLGPLMRAQQALGTVPAEVTEEDVVIIRAVAPAS
jgi:release factor glutamine methyltransferase